MSSNSKKWLLFSIITVIGFFIDWYTKYLASHQLHIGESVPILGKYFQLMLIYNTGALFGINPQAWFPSFQINIFFYIFSAIAIALLVIYYKSVESKALLASWGIALIMPGALGNLFDRIIRPTQGVVDFLKLDLGFKPFNPWPIFNMADVYITVGIMILALDMLLNSEKKSVVPVPPQAIAPDSLSQPVQETVQKQDPSIG
jgi:signal peptidase II